MSNLTINERIKQVRKEKGMSQKQFAALLGVTQSGVSYMEQFGSNISDSSIKSICTMCNLNEEWLRTGTGSMYIESDTFSLNEYAKQHNITELELELIKTYFELDSDIRKALMDHLKKHFIDTSASDDLATTTTTVSEAEAAYIKSRSYTVQNTDSSVMSTTTDNDKKRYPINN